MRYDYCRTPNVTSHLSTNSGQAVAVRLVRLNPKAWPPARAGVFQLELRLASDRRNRKELALHRPPCRPHSGGETLAVPAWKDASAHPAGEQGFSRQLQGESGRQLTSSVASKRG